MNTIINNLNASEHFTYQELGLSNATDKQKANAKWLCTYLLEPIRSHYGVPLVITDSYRPSAHNLDVGGVHDSYHLYNGGHCAADFVVLGLDRRDVYEWIKRESKLPFDKVIYEIKNGAAHCLHIQADADLGPRRQAFIGYIANTGLVKDNRYVQEFDVG